MTDQSSEESRFERALAFIAGLVLVFVIGGLGGFVFRHYSIWPTQDIVVLASQFKDYLETGQWGREEEFIIVDDRPGLETTTEDLQDGFTVLRPDSMLPGYRVILSLDAESGLFAAELFDQDLNVVHSWPLDPQKINPGTTERRYHTQSLEIFPNGNIATNILADVNSMMMLNPCGDVVWKSEPLHFHHSIHLDENMDLWSWRATKYDIGHYQFMAQVDGETGELLKNVSLIDDIINQQPGSKLTFSLPEYYEFQKFLGDEKPTKQYDIFHVNDVEPLRSDMADAFPLFEAGDILASFRESNLVAVFDKDDYTIKWSQQGPWRLQHDADFNADGTISLFSNNQPWGGSDIMVVDPVTREVSRPWASEEAKFYATSGGKQQVLPNGSVLLSATQQGRVLEIAPGGELIAEFVNLAAPRTVGRVQNVIWLPLDFFDELPSCN